MRTMMEVCPSCGGIAPTSNDQCSLCFTAFGQPRLEAQRPADGLMLARLFGEFDCRSCGNKVPLNYLNLDGYPCAACGIEQKFECELWEDIITHVHDTADLTGFDKPSLKDGWFWKGLAEQEDGDIARMFRSIGVNKSTLTKGNSYFGGLPYEVDVSPGNPVCDACAKPLDVSADQSGIRLACSSCCKTSTYSLFTQTARYDGLVGTISHENRTDTPSVHAESASGSVALAISCPKCGGALEVGSMGEVVVCPYCSTTCHVPHRVFQKASGEPVPRQAWWMVFRGKSRRRIAVDKQVAELQRRAQEEQAQREAWEAEAREEAAKARRTERVVVALIASGAALLVVLKLLHVI